MNGHEPPNKSAGDLVHTLVRSGLGVIPFAGQTAIEAFTALVRPPWEKRTVEWQIAIGEAVQRLEERLPHIAEDLANNEVFIDTLVQASQAALHTSQSIKRDALRNAVLNAALPGAPDASRQSIFVNLVDTLSPLHLRILTLLDDPFTHFPGFKTNPLTAHSQTVWPMVAAAYPDLATDEALCERVCRDLNERGLLIAMSLRKNVNRFPYHPDKPRDQQDGYKFADELPSDTAVSYAGSPTPYRHWTTEIGREFIAFISTRPEAAA